MVTTTSSQTFSFSANAGKVVKEINWPLLTSIAFHGVFFTVLLPQWRDYNNSKANNGFSNTPVVQLNAIEQTRLPNLNPLPQTSFNWDSLNTLPQGDTSLPSIPLSALEIPTPPPATANFPPPTFDNSVLKNLPTPPSLPPTASLPPVNYSNNFYTPSPSTPQLPPPPPLNENAIATLPPPVNFDTPKQGNVIDITTDPTNERTITPEESIIRQQIFANSNLQSNTNPRDIINGKITYTPQIRGENDPPLVFESNSNLVAKLRKETQNTSDEDARKNYVAWAKEVQNVAPQQLTLSGIYPKEACVGKLEGTAAYGVTVNSTGNVINTRLIKSSGYPLLNDQALRQIGSHGFANDTGTNKPYHVYVNYNYNSQICPSLSISNLGSDTSKTPTDTPSENSNEPPPTNTSKPPATFSIPKTESNTVTPPPQESSTPPKQESNTVTPPKQESQMDIKQPKPTPAVVAPEVPPREAPSIPQLPEVKPLRENTPPSPQKTLEVETPSVPQSESEPISAPEDTKESP